MRQVIIIAEAGVNHNGSLENAFKLIDVAADAGVDYVKFQTFKANKLVSETARKADYQIQNTKNGGETQFQMLQKLELSEQDHERLIEYSRQRDLQFFSTAFDLQSLQYLSNIGLEMVKIPSGELTNLPYLRLAAKLFSKIILSTGMATLSDISRALDVFLNAGILKDNITILHCNTEYPTPMKDVNLKAMLSIQKEFQTEIGYSDHTLGIEVPIAAVALGAQMIEKHYTLDRGMPGPDHAASLEPQELIAMVSAIRNVEKALQGSGVKEPSDSEKKNINIARKSIHLNKNKAVGDVLDERDFEMLRPGDGISPMEMESLVGKIVKQDLPLGHKLSFLDFE